MSDYTITYSASVKGFPSFYSYIPEYIMGMNNYLYTFKAGNLYRHNTNEGRNKFYNVSYPSTVTSVFNVSPTESKRFKTLSLEADSPWGATFKTNLETGVINSAWYDLKEGSYYASIRANESPVNFHMRSVDGIGDVTTVSNIGTTYTLVFTFAVNPIVSIGDKIYKDLNPELEVGSLTAVSTDRKTLTVTVSGAAPVNGNYIFAVKNPQAESQGVMGYYCEFTLTNTSTTHVELFTVESSIFKSYP